MANNVQSDAEHDGEVQMTPIQCNEVIEAKLTHLKPAMEGMLSEMQRLQEGLSNGEIHWRPLLQRAIKKYESSSRH